MRGRGGGRKGRRGSGGVPGEPVRGAGGEPCHTGPARPPPSLRPAPPGDTHAGRVPPAHGIHRENKITRGRKKKKDLEKRRCARRREGLAAWGGSGDDEREALSKRLVTADKWVSEEPHPTARPGGEKKILKNLQKKI